MIRSQDPSPLDEASLRYTGWRVVLACFLMALFLFGFGLYGHGVYLATDKKYGDFDVVIMEGVGHFLMMEKPKEFNGLVLTFLQKRGIVK